MFVLDELNKEKCAFLLSSSGLKATIALHVEGIINHVDGFNAKK